MDGVNKVIILGNLGGVPEFKGTGKAALLQLSVATEEGYKDKNGEWQKTTEWHRVKVWGPQAERLSRVGLQKGERVYIEGRLQTSSYEKDGQKKYSTDIVARTVILNGRGLGEGGRRSAGGESKPRPPAAAHDDDGVLDDGIDEDTSF